MRRTQALLQLAQAMLARPSQQHWGYDLQNAAGLRSGVLYPILDRMLNEGWLVDGWEDPAEITGRRRPPRRYYRLTELGMSEMGALPAPSQRSALEVRRGIFGEQPS